MRGRSLAAAIAAGALAAPAGAAAAQVYESASTGPAAEDYIQYVAGPAERNRVQVNIKRNSVTIVDRGVSFLELHVDQPYDNCRRTGLRRIVCPREPIFLDLGDRSDTLSFAPGNPGSDHPHRNPLALQDDYTDHDGAVVETTNVDGGSGDDLITGSRFADVIAPGPGRDRVEARGGQDNVYLAPDGVRDVVSGGGGVDGVRFDGYAESRTRSPVTVDLAARTAGPAGDKDRIGGFERVHGGPRGDTLIGTGDADALYGEYGRDRILGRGGNDLVVGDSPITSKGFANRLVGGRGDDVMDARSVTSAPTSAVDCGPGNDRAVGEPDDLLDPSCESAVFRPPVYDPSQEAPLYGVTMPPRPVARDADSVTFDVPCPPRAAYGNGGCTGLLDLSAPPRRDGTQTDGYGSTSFDLAPGERGEVRVPLDAAGKGAVTDGTPVAVEFTVDLSPPPGAPPGSRIETAKFGWQAVLAAAP